ncbi:hypothetical protein J7M00_04420 [bacterium]|nr:hypothetical protein [bacterium]
MTYWIILIICLNIFVLFQHDVPSFVKLNAGMVTVIAFFALVRIIQKKRQRRMEKLLDEVAQLQRENEELRKRLGKEKEENV